MSEESTAVLDAPPESKAPDELLPTGLTKRVVPWEVKAINRRERTFEGFAATWDLDLGGDVIHKGAFKDSLREWKANGRVIPLVDMHNYYTIRAALGKMLDGREMDRGLWTKWYVVRGQDGEAVFDRLEDGVITSMSIGYEALDFKFEQDEDLNAMIRHLLKVGLRETSLVLFPMNPGALIDLDTIKSLASVQALTPEMLAGLGQLRGELDRLLTASAADTKGGAAEDDGLVDPPDTAPLDRLVLSRLGHTFH